MSLRCLLYLPVFLLALMSSVCAQNTDTVRQSTSVIAADTTLATNKQSVVYEDDDFSWFLFFFAFGFFILCLICIGVGMVIATILCLLFIIFISLGIISASFVAGLRKKSFSTGFRVFLILCGIVLGTAIGIIAAFLMNTLLDYELSRPFLFTVGSVSGIISGCILGQLLFIVFRRLLNYGKQKLPLA